MSLKLSWPDIFTTEKLDGKSDRELCADALCAWGNCHLAQPPESFGRVMAAIGQRLHVPPLADDLMEYSNRFMPNAAAQGRPTKEDVP
jgi:hypothetical protein